MSNRTREALDGAPGAGADDSHGWFVSCAHSEARNVRPLPLEVSLPAGRPRPDQVTLSVVCRPRPNRRAIINSGPPADVMQVDGDAKVIVLSVDPGIRKPTSHCTGDQAQSRHLHGQCCACTVRGGYFTETARLQRDTSTARAYIEIQRT